MRNPCSQEPHCWKFTCGKCHGIKKHRSTKCGSNCRRPSASASAADKATEKASDKATDEASDKATDEASDMAADAVVNKAATRITDTNWNVVQTPQFDHSFDKFNPSSVRFL